VADLRPGPRPLLRSFGFAWDGLAEAAVRDRNLRIHLALGVLAAGFVARAPLAPVERALLVLCVAGVVAAEAMNSALEAAVDLACPRFDERARVAKDSAAAAVLAAAAGSVLALLAITGARADELAAWAARLLGRDALALAGAAAASVATGLLPAPRERSRAADALLIACGAAGIAALAAGASSAAGVVTAALCLAVSAGGAARRRLRTALRATAEHHSS
jgi:diacylglycerol kinase (ATP)